MRRRLREPSLVRLPTTQEPLRYDTEPPSLVSTLVHHLHFIRPTENCHRRVRTRQVCEQQEIQATKAQNKSERSGHTPLAFSNCETMRHQFAAHCNKRVRFNDEGPAPWYVGTQYDRDPITGAVIASHELYINKLLARWQMSDCNPTKIPCSGKLTEILTLFQQVPAIPDPALLHDYKELIGSLMFSSNRHDSRDQLHLIRPRTIHDQSRRATHGSGEKGNGIQRKYLFNGALSTTPCQALSTATQTSKSSTSVAQRCSPTFSRHHVPPKPSSHFAITYSDASPRSWLMTTSNPSLICEDARTHHPSLRISGPGLRASAIVSDDVSQAAAA
jgi:hypothetical protein